MKESYKQRMGNKMKAGLRQKREAQKKRKKQLVIMKEDTESPPDWEFEAYGEQCYEE